MNKLHKHTLSNKLYEAAEAAQYSLEYIQNILEAMEQFHNLENAAVAANIEEVEAIIQDLENAADYIEEATEYVEEVQDLIETQAAGAKIYE